MNKIVLGIFVIIIIIFFINNTDKNDIKLYDKIFMINLEKRKDRLNNFNFRYNNSDFKIPYNLFKAFDGRKIDISKYINKNTYNDILITEKTGKRKYHYQLTRGAIGCYLSHVNIWKHILDNNIDSALIFEDDVNINYNSEELIYKSINNIPQDFDIILLGCNCIKCYKKNNYRVVYKFWGLYAYIITKKCIEKIYDKMFPIKQQIDSELSDLSNELNIYSTNTNIIKHANIGESDIQIPIKNNVESFKNYHS